MTIQSRLAEAQRVMWEAGDGTWVESAYEGGWDCIRDRDHDGPIIFKVGLNDPSNATAIIFARNEIPQLLKDAGAEIERLRTILSKATDMAEQSLFPTGPYDIGTTQINAWLDEVRAALEEK